MPNHANFTFFIKGFDKNIFVYLHIFNFRNNPIFSILIYIYMSMKTKFNSIITTIFQNKRMKFLIISRFSKHGINHLFTFQLNK